MAFPSLNQVIFGIGFPVAEQLIVTLVPCKTVCFDGRQTWWTRQTWWIWMNTDSQIKACILQKNSSLFPSRMNRPLRAPTKKDFFTVAIGIMIVLTSVSPS